MAGEWGDKPRTIELVPLPALSESFLSMQLPAHVAEDPDDDNDGVLDEDEDDDEHDEM